MLPPLLLERLRAWWRYGHPLGQIRRGDGCLRARIPSTRWDWQLNRAIHAAAAAATPYDKRVSMHTLRHCFATRICSSKKGRTCRAHPKGGCSDTRKDRHHRRLHQLKVMSAIEQCRSAALGGDTCCAARPGEQPQIAYNSCRNRHCPPSARGSPAHSALARGSPGRPAAGAVLPRRVHAAGADRHNQLLQQGSRLWAAVRDRRPNPAHHRCRPQAPGSPDRGHAGAAHLGLGAHPPSARARHRARRRSRPRRQARCWVGCKPGFFLPVRVLSRLFRRLFLEQLERAHRGGQLRFFGEYADLADRARFAQWLVPLRKTEWVVYAKRPFAGPQAVLAHLSRYTHRVAISNRRLLAFDQRGVTFRWKDYRAKGRTRHKTMTLAAEEFMRRFLLHVLPGRFHRIRHYGLLANAARKENLAAPRALLHQPLPQPGEPRNPSRWRHRPSCAAIAVRHDRHRDAPTPPPHPRPATTPARHEPHRRSHADRALSQPPNPPARWRFASRHGNRVRYRDRVPKTGHPRPASRQASRYGRPNRRYPRLLQQRRPSSNRHSASPLLTPSARPAVSSIEAWTTPALHPTSGGRQRFARAGIDQPLTTPAGGAPRWRTFRSASTFGISDRLDANRSGSSSRPGA